MPEDGRLQHDDVFSEQSPLFGFHVNFGIGIKLVKPDDFRLRQTGVQGVKNRLVGYGYGQIRQDAACTRSVDIAILNPSVK